MTTDIMGIIRGRRSVRRFDGREVPDEIIDGMLEAGRWAPSGLNNQPWAFAVIRDRAMIGAFAGLTRYGKTVESARALVAVFLDGGKVYDRTKDCQSVGACIQNMLLYLHSGGMGGVWLGEILKNGEEAGRLLGAPDGFELMAVIALGWPAEGPGKGSRRPLDELVFYRG